MIEPTALRVLGKIAKVAAREKTRYALNGVLLRRERADLNADAVEGKRTAVTDAEAKLEAARREWETYRTEAARENQEEAEQKLDAAKRALEFVERDLPFADGRPVATATDGKRLVEVAFGEEWPADEWPTEPGCNGEGLNLEPDPEFKALLPGGALVKDVCSLAAAKSIKPILRCVAVEEKRSHEGSIRFQGTDLEVYRTIRLREVEGAFPDYRGVYPTKEPKTVVSLNADLFMELAEAMVEVSRSCQQENNMVTLSIYEDGAVPVRIDAKGPEGMRARGLLMPINLEV